MSSLRRPRVSLTSLGCKVNQYEMRVAAEALRQLGWEIVPFGAAADACVVNTCSVTHEADVKSRAVLRRAARCGDDPLVVATGCYADVAPEEVGALAAVAAVVPNREKPRMAEIVEDILRRSGRLLFDLEESAQPAPEGLIQLEEAGPLTRTRAVLKVQDGCNHFCSFCIIPFARGRLTSRPTPEVLDEARQLAAAGYRELVLTGICIGDYGDERSFPRREDGRDPLAVLLEELAPIPGLARLRISSIDPADVTGDLIDTLARLPQACRHLHLSLQSGDDEVLRRMRRRYDAATFEYLVARLRERIPGLALTADVIVGFPGETDLQFAETVRVCELSAFSKIHVFPYSPRSGTRAAAWPDDVPPPVKEARVRALMALSDCLGHQFAHSFVGETVEMLIENRQRTSGLLTGLTDNYLRVCCDGPDAWRGQLVPVRVTASSAEGVTGEVVLSMSANCIFCQIARGQIPANKLLDEPDLVAFHDLKPQAPTHVLIIPREHIDNLAAAAPEHEALLGRLLLAAGRVAAAAGVQESGFRVAINAGPDAGQSVDHLHVHVLGGRSLGWPPG